MMMRRRRRRREKKLGINNQQNGSTKGMGVDPSSPKSHGALHKNTPNRKASEKEAEVERERDFT